jgi:hypothetical protein
MCRRMFLLLAPILLIGCASPGSDTCGLLPLRTYGPIFSMQLADEVQAAPAAAVWPQAVTDYVALRDAVRACSAK